MRQSLVADQELTEKHLHFQQGNLIPLVPHSSNIFILMQDAFESASSWTPLGRPFAQVAWLRGYNLKQSTCLKLIPSSPADRVVGLGTFGLSAPDYFCPAIIGEKLEATDARWHWMECSISCILCQLRLIHSRLLNI